MDPEFPSSPSKRRRTMSPDESRTTMQPNAEASGEGSLLDALMQQVEAQTEASAPRDNGKETFREIIQETSLPPDVHATNGEMPRQTNGLEEPAVSNDVELIEDMEEVPVSGTEVERAQDHTSSEGQVLPSQPIDNEARNAVHQPSISLEVASASRTVDHDVAMTDTHPVQQAEAEAVQTIGEHTELAQATIPNTSAAGGTITQTPVLQSGIVSPATDTANSDDTHDIAQPAPVLPDLRGFSAAADNAVDAVKPTDQPQEREWETDSSPISSSDSSDLSPSSDDSDEGADGDYAMLDPEEQARILMQDGGSDDEGDKHKGKPNAGVRSANEKPEEVIPKPDIDVTSEMNIEQLGTIEGIVENTVVIRAKISAEYQVLESGSLLCLQNRSVIGVIAEPLGRVEQPMYTVRFTNEKAIKEAGVTEIGTMVYYVLPHSTFVFTQPLKNIRGTDASNFHDEEVGDDEMEFSDDEKEAEYKRMLKMKKRGRTDEGGRGDRGGRGGRGGRGSHRGGQTNGYATNGYPPGSSAITSTGAPGTNPSETLNYDDNGQTDYTPLPRPTNLHEMMGGSAPMEDVNGAHAFPPSHHPTSVSSRGTGRGRGDRGNGRSRGRGRGGFHNDRRSSDHQNSYSQQNSYNQQPQKYTQPQQSMPPPPFPYPQQQQSPTSYHPPQAPYLPPQQNPFSPFSPSPISPLPQGHFNFSSQHGYPSFPPPPPAPQGQNGYNYQNQPGYTPQQNYIQSPPGVQNWPNNAEAMAQVQRQLDDMRRQQGQR